MGCGIRILGSGSTSSTAVLSIMSWFLHLFHREAAILFSMFMNTQQYEILIILPGKCKTLNKLSKLLKKVCGLQIKLVCH